MESEFEEKLQKWAKIVADTCHGIATSSNSDEKVDLFFYALQSPPRENPDLLIIGLNPGENDNYLSACHKRGLERLTDKEIKKENPFWFDSEKGFTKWAIWNRLKISFQNEKMLPILGNSVYMNLLYFNTKNFKEFQSKKGNVKAFNTCCELTQEAILNVFTPKMIICLGVSDCFNGIKGCLNYQVLRTNSKNKKLVIRKTFNDIPVYGIPHPSSARGITNDDRKLIGEIIQKDFFNEEF